MFQHSGEGISVLDQIHLLEELGDNEDNDLELDSPSYPEQYGDAPQDSAKNGENSDEDSRDACSATQRFRDQKGEFRVLDSQGKAQAVPAGNGAQSEDESNHAYLNMLALNNAAVAAARGGSTPELVNGALDTLEAALQMHFSLPVEEQDLEMECFLLNNIGNLKLANGNHASALSCYQRALDIVDSNVGLVHKAGPFSVGNTSEVISCLGPLAANYPKDSPVTEEIQDQMQTLRVMATLLQNIGIIHENYGGVGLAHALAHYLRALDLLWVNSDVFMQIWQTPEDREIMEQLLTSAADIYTSDVFSMQDQSSTSLAQPDSERLRFATSQAANLRHMSNLLTELNSDPSLNLQIGELSTVEAPQTPHCAV